MLRVQYCPVQQNHTAKVRQNSARTQTAVVCKTEGRITYEAYGMTGLHESRVAYKQAFEHFMSQSAWEDQKLAESNKFPELRWIHQSLFKSDKV